MWTIDIKDIVKHTQTANLRQSIR